jgi:hypothetical protein
MCLPKKPYESLAGFIMRLLIDAKWPQFDSEPTIIARFLVGIRGQELLSMFSRARLHTVRGLYFVVDTATHQHVVDQTWAHKLIHRNHSDLCNSHPMRTASRNLASYGFFCFMLHLMVPCRKINQHMCFGYLILPLIHKKSIRSVRDLLKICKKYMLNL